MSVRLVAGASSIDLATTEFNDVLRAYSYNPGKRNAEFRQGDKLAGYGLTALIAGGVGAAAVKTGMLQKLIVLLVVGIAGGPSDRRARDLGSGRREVLSAVPRDAYVPREPLPGVRRHGPAATGGTSRAVVIKECP